MDMEEADWRNSTMFLWDNARYHTSAEMRAYFRKMEVPIIFSGPYSYSASSIETLFSALKRGNLIPERLPVGSR